MGVVGELKTRWATFPQGYNNKAAVVSIVVLGTILRLYHLGTNSLWYDEVATATSNSLASLMSDPSYPAQNMPLYAIATAISGQFGESEYSLRLPAAIVGILTVVVIFLVGRFCFNERVALLGSLIAAASSYQIYYSQEARAYSTLMLLGIVSTYCLIKALRCQRVVWWTGYTLLAALGLYAHLYMTFILLVQNIYLLMQWREGHVTWRTWFCSQAGILLLFAPWLSRYAVYYIELLQGTSTVYPTTDRNLWMPAPTPELVASILKQFFQGKSFDLLFLFPSLNPQDIIVRTLNFSVDRLAFVFYLSLLPLGLGRAWKDKERWPYATLLGMYLTVPLVLMFVASFKTRMLTERYFSFAFPAFCLLLALGIDAFGSYKVKSVLLAGIALVVGISLVNYYFNPQYQKEQWREVASYIEAREQPEDIIIFYAGYVELAFDYYYQGDTKRAGLQPVADLAADQGWSRLRPIVDGHERAWLILAHAFGSGKEVYTQLLGEHCQLFERREFTGIQLGLYEECSP